MAQKFFEILPAETKINFVKIFNHLFAISSVAVLLSLVSLATRGLNYGVDFRGGTEMHVRFSSLPTAEKVREILKPVGLSDAMVQGIGEKGSGEFLIRVESYEINLEKYKAELERGIQSASPAPDAKGKIRFSEDRMYVTFGREVSPDTLKETISSLEISDLRVDSVSPFGKASDYEWLVQFAGVSTRMVDAFQGAFGKGNFEVMQVEQVGPKAGAELRKQALGAVIISLFFILIYVWFRFDFVFAPGATLSLVHDTVVVLGLFSLFQWTFDLSIVAAVLTIVGYSINDTIVLYDRVRENLRKVSDPDLPKVLNLSINQTLARTVLTSFTVLIASLTLIVLGGPITHNFALAFTIGILVGSYSSAFVAAPITVYLNRYMQRKKLAA